MYNQFNCIDECKNVLRHYVSTGDKETADKSEYLIDKLDTVIDDVEHAYNLIVGEDEIFAEKVHDKLYSDLGNVLFHSDNSEEFINLLYCILSSAEDAVNELFVM